MTEERWCLPKNLLQESIAIMRPHGTAGNEGLALWLGTDKGNFLEVKYVVEVFGPGFRTTPLYMSLSLKAMAKLTDLADELNTFLVGQIHSHPDRMLDLSILDKEQGIRIPGYLSVVCPYYAQRDISGLDECGVHVFEQRVYRKMAANEISRRIVISNVQVQKIRCEVPA